MKQKKIALVVMDGVGYRQAEFGNAVAQAYTPTLDALWASCPHTLLQAHGTAVGLPSDEDMGNSEVGHNALGCGQIYAQGAKLVNDSIASGRLFRSQTWRELLANCAAQTSTLHFLGLLSDGNVHSHIDHLLAMLSQAKQDGARRVRVHILLDGRDVPARSALTYVERLEATLAQLNDGSFDGRIASGGGRMSITMDRYGADWGMVEAGWRTHVLGQGRGFASAAQAIETYRAEGGPELIDQDLPAFVIQEQGQPVGTIEDGDSVVLFNFRGDRAIEISTAFDAAAFPQFERQRRPRVYYAGMLEYDGDLHIPGHFLVSPPEIRHTLSELLISQGLRQFAVSETQKYGHVTYFWNGNRLAKFDEKLETFLEIPSDVVPFDQRPWMKAAEVTDAVLAAMAGDDYDFIRCNFPNGDMVGHTGDFRATRLAVEAVDLSLARLVAAAQAHDCLLLITADHGNADQMLERNKAGQEQIRTAHSLSPVPFILVDDSGAYRLRQEQAGLANVAATVAQLFGITPPPCWQPGLLG